MLYFQMSNHIFNPFTTSSGVFLTGLLLAGGGKVCPSNDVPFLDICINWDQLNTNMYGTLLNTC